MKNLVAKSIQMRLVDVDDAAFIVGLRLDPAKNKYISKVGDSVDGQRRWISAYKDREAARSEYYFVIETRDGVPCGVVRLYDFRGNSFCWGSWILADNAPRKAAIESALLVYKVAFGPLGFTECHFDVRLGNEKALAFHDRLGATRTTVDDLNQYFIYTKARYEADKPKFAEFLAP